MEFLRRVLGIDSMEAQAAQCRAVGDEAECLVDASGERLAELDRCIAEAEAEVYTLESREEKMREDAEALLMEVHDAMFTSPEVAEQAQRSLEHDLRNILESAARRRESFELRILKLRLKRARLMGEHCRAEELLRDLGRVDPLHGIQVDTLPPYPNVVRDTKPILAE